ncbi:hypothetical protein Csa_019239 [Cucumis sativus]|uniref:Uncharacterized protein n=1 Tax=Cucumis sativus TaxID=3659 RepID=A0A0A0LHY5_CUCSA|nr:hypothetical protein Csa_019239 [Cucumis sativus]
MGIEMNETALKGNLPKSNLSISLSHFILYVIQLSKFLTKTPDSLPASFLPSGEIFFRNFPEKERLTFNLFSTNILNFFNLLSLISVTGSVAGKRSKL